MENATWRILSVLESAGSARNHNGFGSQSKPKTPHKHTLEILRTDTTCGLPHASLSKNQRNQDQNFAGTGMCVHIPFRLNPIASLAWLGKQLPCPLLEEQNKAPNRQIPCDSKGFTHTPPLPRGEAKKQFDSKGFTHTRPWGGQS